MHIQYTNDSYVHVLDEQIFSFTAVREDRMPGGRNSGAVYNMYKVKYKKRPHSTGRTENGKKGTLLL